jgi:Fe-S-cluster containining protein
MTIDAGTPTAILHDWRRALDGGDIPVPCGACTACCRSDMPVRLRDDEPNRFPHEIVDGKPVLAKRGRDCVMFDAQNNRCSVYENRPIGCRQYDCRQLWMSGFRNGQRGEEMNERLDEWRTQMHNDMDLGIVALMWLTARELVKHHDIGLAAALAALKVMCASADTLRAYGRRARRGGIENVLKVLNGRQG